ncbi:Ig-like domain-containing protein [Anatilimnocola floriformis]|uniref:Ig-like domain-containing protein n=1 Tax=Anatilimnocola floriformis TaxID=2948575 RepID=UPI0020C44D0E|nr:Ig-like domain-containing protein [Anatilimnocola floriformis]
MKKQHRSLAQRTIDSLKQLWTRRERQNADLRGKKKAFFFDQLEARELMASDLGNSLPDTNNDTPAIVSQQSAGEASVLANDLVAFAKALSAANVKFYGAAWCPHCTATKNLFEDGAKYLNFIEVTNPDHTPNAIATANNITTYPTWVFQDGSRLTGEQTLAAISAKAGIAIPQTSTPFLAELPETVLNGGSPLMVSLDGYDPNGGTLTYTVTSDNPSLVTPTILQGNQSLKMNVQGYGTMTYQLFDNFVPRVTARIKQLVNSGFYNATASNEITFHRVIDNFVLQAGDPTGTGSGGSSLGDFDDQFNVDLQHNRSGLLSMAKSSDDTNDSQFFITEDNQSWEVTLGGSPTGGTFTLSYKGQTTGPITFTNAATTNGSLATTATAMQTALEQLTGIGAGNIKVEHDPQLSSTGAVVENRRFRVEFLGQKGAVRTIYQVTGNGAGLTGGTSSAVSVSENFSARHLDFNHSIFGVMTEGEAVREAISEVPVDSNDKPTTDVIIDSMQIFTDTENGVLMLKAAEGATGSANITVRATDADGQFVERTFHVEVRADNKNGAPFLSDIAPVNIVQGGVANFTLQSTDVENNPVTYVGVKPSSETVNYTFTVNPTTGAVQITPPSNFVGTFKILLGVQGATTTDTSDQFDSQLVTVNVGPSGTLAVDLTDASDSGSSNTDNVTNAGSLSFLVTGVSGGATVKLYNGNTVIGQATAASGATSVTITTTAISTLASGTYQISATQTLNGGESAKSTALPLVYDKTAPGAFTSTAPTEATDGVAFTYNAQSPDEGQTGYVYSLASGAPAGVSIQSQTGIVVWTPTTAQVGAQTFTIIGTDLAGNSVSQTVNLTVAAAAVKDIKLTLKIVDANGNVLNNLTNGQEFYLAAFVQDTRTVSAGSAFGVFSFYTDVTYSSNVQVNGAIERLSTYTSAVTGTTTTPGLLDEVGGLANTFTALGQGEIAFFRIPMKAIGGGTVTFAADPHDTESLDIVTYGAQAPTTPSQITYGTATATIGLDFTAVNDTVNFNEDSTNNTINPLANDTVTSGSVSDLVITAVGTTSNGGTVSIAADGKTLSYTPAANYNGLETFTYTIRRGASGATTTATVNVQVQPVNDAPNAVDDTKTVNENSTDNTIDVLGNDLTTPDTNETIKVTAVGQGNHGGTITIVSNGSSIRYTPAPSFVGTETFTYTITDTGGLTDTATVTVTVLDGNDPPVANADTATTTEDIATPIFINVLANDTTGNDTGETLTVQSVTQGSNGGVVAVANNGANVSYKPAANFQGTETFSYTVSDGNGGTSTATVTVTVTNTNDVPVATADTLNAFKNSTTTLNVLTNDNSGVDPTETLIVSAVTQGSQGGSITITPGGGSVKYTPANNFTGSETFTYTIQDPGGLTATATVTVTVLAYSPSTLAGYVFKNGTTGGLAGVTITLTGTDVNSAAVSRTVTTGTDGSYLFDALLPGTYKIKETQPAFMTDGVDVVGSQGGTLSANDEISVTLTQGTTGTGNNFGEKGLVGSVTTGTGSTATTNFVMKKFDLTSHNSKNYVLAAVDTSTGQVWYSDVGSSFIDTSTQTSFAVNSTGANATDPKLTIQTKDSTGTQKSATISVSNPNVRTLASSGTMRLYRLKGSASFYNFTPLTTASTSAGEDTSALANNSSAGEFVDPQQAQATDTLMALLGSDNGDDGNDAN